jgi:hypothetical protein
MSPPSQNNTVMTDPVDGKESPYKRSRDERKAPAPHQVQFPTRALLRRPEPPDERLALGCLHSTWLTVCLAATNHRPVRASLDPQGPVVPSDSPNQHRNDSSMGAEPSFSPVRVCAQILAHFRSLISSFTQPAKPARVPTERSLQPGKGTNTELTRAPYRSQPTPPDRENFSPCDPHAHNSTSTLQPASNHHPNIPTSTHETTDATLTTST